MAAAFILLACSNSRGSTVATPTALPCIAAGSCTLREAAEAARLRLGVAAAPLD